MAWCKKMYALCLFVSALYFIGIVSSSEYHNQPEQVHISLGENPSQIIVTYSTQNCTNTSLVYYGQGIPFLQFSKGNCKKFVDGGSEKSVRYIHKVVLTGLKPATLYYYKCGHGNSWSAVFHFTTIRDDTNWSPRFAVYGDMGDTNAQSIPRLQKEVQMNKYDVFLHVGDMAYDLQTDNGRVGDEFMRELEPIAAYVPYMTCPGNHENYYNFSNYKARFNMPTDPDGKRLYYSFTVGPARIISINTEYYFYIYYGLTQIYNQFEWLKKELQEANKPENRAKHPWIITMGHRPMYCSNSDNDDCTHVQSLVRVGVPYIHIFGMENMLNDYGVDLALWAHEHSYERLWPLYKRQVHNGSYEAPYTNPGAPVHIITGSAGCLEKHNPFQEDRPPWSAFRSTDYGYTTITIQNSTHLYLNQISDDKGGKVIDQMTLIRDKHGPYKN